MLPADLVLKMFLNVGGVVPGVAVLTVISDSITSNKGGKRRPRRTPRGLPSRLLRCHRHGRDWAGPLQFPSRLEKGTEEAQPKDDASADSPVMSDQDREESPETTKDEEKQTKGSLGASKQESELSEKDSSVKSPKEGSELAN